MDRHTFRPRRVGLLALTISAATALLEIAWSGPALARDVLGTVLDKYRGTVTPLQTILIRNYVGQYGEELKVNYTGVQSGAETFTLVDKKTGDRKGEVAITVNADKSVAINKIVGATFEMSGKVEIPILANEKKEEADKIFSGTREGRKIEKGGKFGEPGTATPQDEKFKLEIEVPAIKLEGKATLGNVKVSGATFESDGSGQEYAIVGKGPSVSAEASVGTTLKPEAGSHESPAYVGVKAGAGAKLMTMETSVTAYGTPDVDEHGKFTRRETGVAVEQSVSIAQIEAKAGCEVSGSCEVKWSAGALGYGVGVSFRASGEVEIPTRSALEIEAEEQEGPPIVRKAEGY